MHTLQDIFEKQFQEQFKFSGFVATLIEKEIEKKGVQLTKKQNEQLVEGLQKKVDEDTISEGLSVQIDDDGTLRVTNETGTSDSNIDIYGAAETKINKIIENLPSIVEESSDAARDVLLQDIKNGIPTLLGGHRKDQLRFKKQLNKKWGGLLNLLEAFILVSQEIGAEYNEFIRGDSEKEISPRFDVLSRSHARSCQVALEILVLLQQGFADGAHARWRTLHEIAVECFIINKGDDNLAIRYLDYDIVQKRKYAKVYRDHCHEINYEPISDDDMKGLDNDYKKLIEIYDDNFTNENGWAADLVGKPSPKFSDLEKIAKFEHIRPFYKLACQNVHGGPRGILFRLGLNNGQQEKILLAGPSTNGLAEPIQNTAYSIMLITSSLLTFKINMDYLVAMKVLAKLEPEIFEAADQRLHEDYDE